MTFYAAKENVNRVCICYFCGYNPLTADNMDKISFNQVVSRGCGIDVHKESVMATIDGEGIRKVTKPFGTFTSPLTDLRDWSLENGTTHVAMESTGVYWKPVYNVLESAGLTVWIVNARHIKYVPGHKTDKKDSACICKLLLAGLLKPSYIPPKEQRELRDLTRYRKKLIESITANKNRIIRILEVSALFPFVLTICITTKSLQNEAYNNIYLRMKNLNSIMKSIYFTMSLLLIVFLMACVDSMNDINNIQKKEKFSFIDDKLLMCDIERETQFVDSALCEAKTLRVKSKIHEKSNALPLNSREQAIKFFKYLNTAVESNGKLNFVFYDKSSDKIVDLSLREKDLSIYIKLNRKQFEDKLKTGDIDFKLIRNENKVPNTLSEPLLRNYIENEEGLEPTDTMYNKFFYPATGTGSVLGGLTHLCTQLLWYKKIPIIGFILSDPRPGVEGSETFFTEIYFGDFYKSVSGFSYQEDSRKIVGYVMGRYEVKAELVGLELGAKYKIEARMKVDMDNHVKYEASSSLFR